MASSVPIDSGGSRKFWWGGIIKILSTKPHKAQKFKVFFRPKSGGLQKKKKKKERSSPKLRLIFRPKSLGLGWLGGCIPPIPPPKSATAYRMAPSSTRLCSTIPSVFGLRPRRMFVFWHIEQLRRSLIQKCCCHFQNGTKQLMY